MHNTIAKLLENEPKTKLNFDVGDSIRVHYRIVESGKERIQAFEGLVIAIQNEGYGKTFTVRRVSYDVGVERIFPLHSPKIARIELLRKGKVRRAKLYYVRDKSGKEGRIKEKKGGQTIVAREKKAYEEQLKAEKLQEAKSEPTPESSQ